MRPGSPGKLLAAAGATAFASNIMNNLPAALIARSVLLASHAHTGTVLASLVGADVGSMITPFGSLATMLVLTLARSEGEDVRAGNFVMFGLWATPVIVVATALALTVCLAMA
jgi:arsenical pump membrane protein